MKTYMPKKGQLKREYYLIDARGKVLGRLASQIAKILQGKHRSTYVPFLDTGSGLIVINAKKIVVTGKKLKDKIYTRYSGYPGGLKKIPLEKMMREKPTEVLRHAVRGMLPKSPLGRKMLKKLKIYPKDEFPQSQKGLQKIEV